MNERNDLRSQTLDLLRFPLAVVIVLIHVFTACGFMGGAGVAEVSAHPLLVAACRFVNAFFKGQSVPVYFFISGYVFFLGIELTKDGYIRKLRNRVKSLLVPYLVWNLAAVLLLAVKFLPSFHPRAELARTFVFSWHGFLSAFWIYDCSLIRETLSGAVVTGRGPYPADYPLWFLRDLMIVAVLTPLIWHVIRLARHYAVILLGALWLLAGYFIGGHAYQMATALFFFSFGAYMSISRKDMLAEFGKWFRLSVIVYPLLGILYFVAEYRCPEWSRTVKYLNTLAGLLFAYNLAAWLLRRGLCRVSPFLSSASFFIYVSHTLLYDYTNLFLRRLIGPSSDASFIVMYLLSAALTVVLLLSVFWVLRRFCPSVLKVVAGRK